MTVLPLYAGAVVDHVHRIRLLYLTQTLQMLTAFVLAALTWLGLINVWHVLASEFIIGALLAFDNPARQALIPDLVERPVASFAPAATGDVIETMKASKRLPRRLNSLRCRLRAGRVTNQRQSRFAKRLLRSLRIVFVASDDDHGRASFNERLCCGEPNSRRAAHDDEDFVGQLRHAA